MNRFLLLSILLMATSGCTSPIVKTTRFPIFLPKEIAETPRTSLFPEARIGLPYYLPTALVPVTITLDTKFALDEQDLIGFLKEREETDEPTNSKDKLGKKKDQSVPTKPPPLSTNNKTPKVTIGALLSGGQEATQPSTDGGKADESTNNNDKPSTKKEQPDAPKPPLLSQKIGPYQVTVGAPVLIPDTSAGVLFLEYSPSPATEDALTFGVGVNQLLQSINAKSIDKSGETLVTLAKIGVQIAALASGVPLPAEPKSSELAQEIFLLRSRCSPLEPINISTYLDPTSIKNDPIIPENIRPFSIDALNQLFKSNNIPLEFDSELLEPITSPKTDRKTDEDAVNRKIAAIDKYPAGVLFRVTESYQLKLSLREDINKKTAESKPWCIKRNEFLNLMVMAPSKKRTYSIDVNRGALITKTTNLTIVDGVLTKIEVNKPSSLLAGLNLPLEIINAILSPITNLLTLRIKQTNTPKPTPAKPTP